MIMIKLKNIIKEDSSTNIENRINYLVNIGFKRNKLKLKKAQNVYFIILPGNAFTADKINYILKGFSKYALIGTFTAISKYKLAIKTTISI